MDGTEPYSGYDYDPAVSSSALEGTAHMPDSQYHAPSTVDKDTPPEPSPYVHDSLRTSELDLEGESFSLPEKYSSRHAAYGDMPLIPLTRDSRRSAIHPLVIVDTPPGYDESHWRSLDTEGIFTESYKTTAIAEERPPFSAEEEETLLPQTVESSGGGGGTTVVTEDIEEAEAHDPSEMPFLDHLEEFRWALLKSIAAVIIGMISSWFLTDYFYKTFTALANKAELPLITTKLLEPLMIKLQMALVMGAIIAFPFVFYFGWSFVAPGLYNREKRWILPLVFTSSALFFAGVCVAYFVIVPMVLMFLKEFTPHDIQQFVTIGNFMGVIIRFVILFGAMFQMPLISFILAKIGIIKHTWMSMYRKYAIVVIFVLGAVLTPPDPLSQCVMALPLILLYEISILVARIAGRKTII